MAMRGPRHPIGAAPWIAEERKTALQITQSEVEEFSFSAKNEMDWLNEHMADIFSENQINVADIFKTPGKLRGKTPRTARKANRGDFRAPLTDIFSSTPKGTPNPFAISKLALPQRRPSPSFQVAEDRPLSRSHSRSLSRSPRTSLSQARSTAATTGISKKKQQQATKKAAATTKAAKAAAAAAAAAAKPQTAAPQAAAAAPSLVDSGYHGSQSQDGVDMYEEDELAASASRSGTQPMRPATPEPQTAPATPEAAAAVATTAMAPEVTSPDEIGHRPSPTQPAGDREPSFHSAKEEQTAVVAPQAVSSPSVVSMPPSSSPVVDAPSPSPVRTAAKTASPTKQPSMASPHRKPVPVPVPQPSSPLQSTTPACPPPPGLLSALAHAIGITSSPSPQLMEVPPAVPTPPVVSDSRYAVAAHEERNLMHVEVEEPQEPKESEEREESEEPEQEEPEQEEPEQEEPRSPPPNPARPVVRKSSINFASLPAREPFTSNKSMGGARLSRTSHIDPARASYYNRLTGGKSLGNARPREEADDEIDEEDEEDEEDEDDRNAMMDADDDDDFTAQNTEKDIAAHNKTYTQRLQDRISMLGKSQASGPRPSKSLASHLPGNALAALAQQPQQPQQPPAAQQVQQAQQRSHATAPVSSSPAKRDEHAVAAPGAFPEDDEDWIVPPDATTTSPRLNMSNKSLTAAEVLGEAATGSSTNATRGLADPFVLPKQRQDGHSSRPASPKRPQAQPPVIPERTTSAFGHQKSASVPSLPLIDAESLAAAAAAKKPISVSNPTNPTNASSSTLPPVAEAEDRPFTPSKSPSRNFRDSPLKQVKNKLSSILKSSKGLLASSAALSAEGKSSLLSPSTTRLGLFLGPSTDSLLLKARNGSVADLAAYPDLSRQISAHTVGGSGSEAPGSPELSSPKRAASPVRHHNTRRTRASVERERREQREQKQREKEQKEAQKEAQRLEEQMGRLEKMREKEREKARVFSEEQEKIAAMERQVKEKEEQRKQNQHQNQHQHQKSHDDDVDMAEYTGHTAHGHSGHSGHSGHPGHSGRTGRTVQPVPPSPSPSPRKQKLVSSPARAPAKATRSSPRRVKAPQPEPSTDRDMDGDMDMAEAPSSMLPPPPPPTHNTASATRSAQGGRTIRRPVKPSKETSAKTKQAPTVIRINTSSSQQQSQFHPSNSVLAATLHETLMGPQHSLRSKASAASLHNKPSLQSLKSSVSSTGRPKALELAAKRKEQEERDLQRKREAKAEMERKRAAAQEQEEQRRQELQRQKERDAEAAKKAAAAQQRHAAIEKAKQTRAPPPAPRTALPSGPSDYGRSETQQQPPRPQSRLATAPGSTASAHRSQDELHRPVNAVLSNAGKSMSKRPLPGGGADGYDRGQNLGRSVMGGNNGNSNNTPTYQTKDAKRIRMSEEFDEDELEMGGGHVPRASNIKGPPVRPSGGFKKSIFGNGYSTAPSANVSRDLFKSTVTAQHSHQTRAGNPMDMAQVSKSTIPFANPNGGVPASASSAAAAAASSAVANPHKTPARPAGVPLNKSVAKSAVKSAAKSVAKLAGKSAAKSSPRFPNGDGIELPEIQTDDEDSEEEGPANVAPWADSPDLRRALMRQETIDPMAVFGPPRPLNMEEVFSKSKERWNKFRARTSSANWSGIDRLTEDDIRKDLAARDRIRREGGWSYDLSRDMM